MGTGVGSGGLEREYTDERNDDGGSYVSANIRARDDELLSLFGGKQPVQGAPKRRLIGKNPPEEVAFTLGCNGDCGKCLGVENRRTVRASA